MSKKIEPVVTENGVKIYGPEYTETVNGGIKRGKDNDSNDAKGKPHEGINAGKGINDGDFGPEKDCGHYIPTGPSTGVEGK